MLAAEDSYGLLDEEEQESLFYHVPHAGALRRGCARACATHACVRMACVWRSQRYTR
jgi:hypothetical protein